MELNCDGIYLHKKFTRIVHGEEECILPMGFGVIVNNKFLKYEAFSRFEFIIKWSNGSTSLFYCPNFKEDLIEYNDGTLNSWERA